MGEVVYVLFGHRYFGSSDFYGVFYSVEQAEEHMKDLLNITCNADEHIYLYDKWSIMPQIVGNPDEDSEDVIFYTSEGIRRN